MDDEKALEILRKLHSCRTIGEYDPEEAHVKADNLLCELLMELGYESIVLSYKEVRKWYA